MLPGIWLIPRSVCACGTAQNERPSFSITAVPHKVLNDCPSSCPIVEHTLVLAVLNWEEKGFYPASHIQKEVRNVRLENRMRSLIWSG